MYDVTFSQIKAFERTVRLGGVHAAARDLGLTQPAISQRIKELERALGTPVFVRAGRSLRLNPDGAALLGYADRLLKTADEMSVRMSTGDPLDGVLRLGVSASFAAVCLQPLLKRLNREYVNLKTSVYVGDSNSISDLLNDQKLDLAVTSEYKIADHIHRRKLGVNQHGWFTRSDNKISTNITREELACYPLILTPPPAKHNTNVMHWFAQADVTPDRVSTCNDLTSTVQMILNGMGIGLLPKGVMQNYLLAGTVKELNLQPAIPGFDVWVCYQVEELGVGLQQVVDLIDVISSENEIYA